MEHKNTIGNLMTSTMEKLKEMVDSDTVVGTPIQADGVTIIPVSKVSVGFASGGSDFAAKVQRGDSNNSFGGGGGASLKITPVSFLIVKGDNVKMLYVDPPAATTVDRVVEMVPEVVDKVTGFIEKQKEDKAKEEGIAF
ncbi:sporulation protein YtfJ [Pseudoflavonifractor sp. 524-17]|uniref:GerW family sporulation protein n=1 Tax=Pseudoflavonifractor sp. 524-17 TaxID=2304577 RepID=UPI00137949B5|nr:GerW family sporulation protein [Pseudoflavonifractor sp. 524-17]NCE64211.1 sporulation protein YtfJ [Pseudoflavonifractor sp. 524-17]